MKKVLSTIAALGLVAGIATSASALELKSKGSYTLDNHQVFEGRGVLNGNGIEMQDAADKPNDTDGWFEHRFQYEPTLIVNDKVSIKARIRFIDWGVWGKQDDTSISDGANFSVRRMWMVYKSPVGVWEIGRRPAGAWENNFVNTAGRGDRIMWKSAKMFGPDVSMYAFYQKITDVDGYENVSDRDYDYVEAYTAFKGFGKTSIAVGYYADNTQDFGATTTVAEDGTESVSYGFTKNRARIKGYGDYQFTDMLGMELEFDYISGTVESNQPGKADKDITGMAFMADLQANFGAAQTSLMYFYLSGDDNATDNDLEAYSGTGGSGADFEPLYVLTGAKTSILNNDMGSSNEYGAKARNAGVHAIVLSADFQASDKLGLHAAVGAAEAASELPGYDSDYGYEVNAGASYKLLDNLTYNLHFGWLATGDFFKLGTANDVQDITVLYNNLTMTF